VATGDSLISVDSSTSQSLTQTSHRCLKAFLTFSKASCIFRDVTRHHHRHVSAESRDFSCFALQRHYGHIFHVLTALFPCWLQVACSTFIADHITPKWWWQQLSAKRLLHRFLAVDLTISRVSTHVFKNHFPHFQFLSNSKWRKFSSTIYLHFSRSLFTKLNFTHLHTAAKRINCFTFSIAVITCKEQNLNNNGWMVTASMLMEVCKLVCFVCTPTRATKKLEWKPARRQQNAVTNYTSVFRTSTTASDFIYSAPPNLRDFSSSCLSRSARAFSLIPAIFRSNYCRLA